MVDKSKIWIWIKRKGENWHKECLHSKEGPNKELCPVRLFLRYIELTHTTENVQYVPELQPKEEDRPPTRAKRLWLSILSFSTCKSTIETSKVPEYFVLLFSNFRPSLMI